jgi:hypothetical protein
MIMVRGGAETSAAASAWRPLRDATLVAVLYKPFLSAVHERLAPRRYLEIGVRQGDSLALARCPALGIDPAYAVTAELDNQVTLRRTSSDEYFARPEVQAAVGVDPFDLVFIDGLHLFEFAFRDFLNAERHSSRSGVIIFDDVLPRSVDEAARERHTGSWTGDVYPMLAVLARYRPDLVVVPVGTQPTGLLLVTALDPESTVLADHYDEIIATYRHRDPQPVPEELFDRLLVVPPERVLEAPVWESLADRTLTGAERSARIKDEVSRAFGSAFAGVAG